MLVGLLNGLLGSIISFLGLADDLSECQIKEQNGQDVFEHKGKLYDREAYIARRMERMRSMRHGELLERYEEQRAELLVSNQVDFDLAVLEAYRRAIALSESM